jgi:3-oxoacyl-[acyl-carrier-protein] synthase-3
VKAEKPEAHLIGLGSYLPERILSNADLEQMVDTSDEWIVSRTGMKERRIADADQQTSDMGAIAALKALAQAGKSPAEVDMILVATMTPDYITPSTAALIQAKIGADRAAAIDIQAACTGYLYGLSIAKAFVESGLYRTVLLIAAEKMSAFIDYTDRNTCVLFGDGASAAVVSDQRTGYRILDVELGADGKLADLMKIPGGGSKCPTTAETVEGRLHYFKMDGKEVFKHAVRRMGAIATDCLRHAGLSMDQIQWVIPHQANIRIIEALEKNLEIAPEKMYKTLHKYGNTSGASVAIALDELAQEKVIREGDYLLLVAVGVGLTWGATILTKVRS